MDTPSSLITQALPPLLSSIGGFFVLLFFGYSKDEKGKRLMSASLLVLLIWIAYVCVTMAGEKITLFSPYITVLCLILSAVIFTTVFIFNVRAKVISEVPLIALFSLGILFATAGFVNYFGMDGLTIIAVDSSQCDGVLSLKKTVDSNTYAINEISAFGEIGFVVTNKDAREIQSISIECEGASRNENSLIAFSKSSRGTGVEYVYSSK